jgi:Xaa-Pro aminopeptidase
MLLNRERALAMMDKHRLDALVAVTPENVYYLSDYGTEHSFHFAPWGLSCAILPRAESIPPTLTVHEWELPHLVARPTWMPEVRVQTGFDIHYPKGARIGPDENDLWELVLKGREKGVPNRQRLLGQTLQELGLDRARLGFDDPRVMLELRENELAHAECRDAVNVFREIRVVKTSDELELLRRGARMIQTALEGVANLAQEGTTTRELMHYFKSSMAAQGGYGSHMTGGGGSRPWLSHPNESYVLKRGDVLYLDPAGHYRHYWCDMGRAAQIGPPTQKFIELYSVLQECHRSIVPQLRPGMTSAELRQQARELTHDNMPAGLVALCHAIGIEQYDQPESIGGFLTDDFMLEDGIVINFETLYFELGWGVLQLEDTYHVTAAGAERLQTMPQEPFLSG